MRHSFGSKRRKGASLLMALVVMAVLSVLLTVVTVQVMSRRQQVRQRQRQLQAEWLARAGVELAVGRLLDNPAVFTEENRDLLPEAKVRITLEKSAKEIYTISSEAELTPKDESPVARTMRGHYRRTDSGGVIRMLAVPLEKKKAGEN